VLAACRFYHALLPDVFEKLDDETELLLPDDLLTEHSVAHGFRTEIADADCAEVEIIGWLYQFYISEKKDQVMARKATVPTEDIPAVTQLFTPHWIVRYLVENSLGRLWLLNRPSSRLREHMPYYIEPAKGSPSEASGEETDFLKIAKPEEIRVCDPAVGSGHMLTYAFDLLYLIYEEEGYAPSEVPGIILRHNLHGLEICSRAAQLAELALVFKAREKSRRFFQSGHFVRPDIVELRDVRYDEGELSAYFESLGAQPSAFHPQFLTLLHQFEEAKNFGSLIQPCLSASEIISARAKLSTFNLQLSTGDLMVAQTHLKVLRVFEQAEALTQQYYIVVANPPYMGGKGMNIKVRDFLEEYFSDHKSDLFAGFVIRCLSLARPRGYLGLMTPFTWMFIKTYEPLRRKLLDSSSISSLVRPEYHAFFDSAYVPICAFTVSLKRSDQEAVYIDLTQFYGSEIQEVKALEAVRDTRCSWRYSASSSDLKKVPGSPIAYWVSSNVRDAFARMDALSKVASPAKGMFTGDNSRFLRLWWEVSNDNSLRDCRSHQESACADQKWYPLQKGGEFRRWYGNEEYVVNFKSDGRELKAFKGYGERNPKFYFTEGLSWTKITSSTFSARYSSVGHLYDDASCVCPVFDEDNRLPVLGLLNSSVGGRLIGVISQTLNFSPGELARVPFSKPNRDIDATVSACVERSRADWDNFETSWDFRDQPLLRQELKGATLEASWRNWEAHCGAAIRRMQELETENNRLFIAAYGLDGELQPEVPEDRITLARAEVRRDMAAFLSYAVGCMTGRYSLDQPGLILANAGDTLREYVAKVGRSQDELTFAPDADGIIPVLDGEWFEDDIVARTRDFLRATFHEMTLNENIGFIEESLGKDLRKYFIADFYKNHLSNERAYGYKKRPIYWLFRSPKGGFAALAYLHRMTRDTPNIVLNCYLRPYLQKLRARIEHLDHAYTNASAREKTVARKEGEQLRKTLRECEEWERDVLLPLAQSRPELDLDDGVKVNYLKLGAALAPIPGLAATEEK
jgi:hypothetical protein